MEGGREEWNGMEWSGMEWNGTEWNGMEGWMDGRTDGWMDGSNMIKPYPNPIFSASS